MKLVVTIDTEEDNWVPVRQTCYAVDNISRIPSLQQLFDDFAVKPTYFITYPVTTNDKAVSILSAIFKEGRCEIGAHCHPWNTPPSEEDNHPKNSMLCNLPPALQYRKIRSLHGAIQRNFGHDPISFRSGRWGFSQDVARNLHRVGYKIDTSITPYTDWRRDYGPDFSNLAPRPFRFSTGNTFEDSQAGPLIEVPVTIGFLQPNFGLTNSILKALRRRPIRHLRLSGVLCRLNLLNKVWLSPEVSDSKQMIGLTQRMMQGANLIINMTFHSSSLTPGLTPFVRTKSDEERFVHTLREFLTFCRDVGISPIKLCDVLNLV